MHMELGELKAHLFAAKPRLAGDWVNKNSGYEEELAALLDAVPDTSRYWDANWRTLPLEFKKGRSIWLDLVRYSEIQIKTDAESSRDTVTLFFLPNKGPYRDRIHEIVCVETSQLVTHLAMTNEEAKFLIGLSSKLRSSKHSLNAQASLSVRVAKEIASFVV